MLAEDAHFAASSALTSLPSGATVALSWEPSPIPAVDVEVTEPPALNGKDEPLLLMLEGVVGGKDASISVLFWSARSSLLPTRRRVRFGDARARASFMKEGRLVKVLWDVRS